MQPINLLDDDLLLWDKFRNGDADAFAALIRVHYQDLFNYGTRIARDEELVKDGIQDLLLSLWKNRSTISGTSFVKYYLLKSLRRGLMKTMDKRRHFSLSDYSYFEGIAGGQGLMPEGHVGEGEMAELSQKIRKLLKSMPLRQQEAIYLRYYMDADIEEIGEIMDLNRQSVYNLLHRSLKKLKKTISREPSSLQRYTGFFLFLF